MLETRCECNWCHEIVSVIGDGRPSVVACTGQPLHSSHNWDLNHCAVRERIPFEIQRRFPPLVQASKREAMPVRVPVG